MTFSRQLGCLQSNIKLDVSNSKFLVFYSENRYIKISGNITIWTVLGWTKITHHYVSSGKNAGQDLSTYHMDNVTTNDHISLYINSRFEGDNLTFFFRISLDHENDGE